VAAISKEDAMTQATQAVVSSSPAAFQDVAVTREIFVPGGIADVFDFVAGEDVLPKILTGYGLVPAVAFTSGVSGPWHEVGSHRIVHLADGSTAEERVTQYDRASYFAYRVSNPSFALKYLMTEARGQFWFVQENGGTRIKWTYTFAPKNAFARIPLMLFVKTQWKGFMKVCLKNVVLHFEGK
jgi:hypothetical protein